MDARISSSALPTADVYTDVRGLQSLKTEKDQSVALKKIAQQFESLFLHEMLKTMRKANESLEKDSLFNGGDTQFFRDMYDQQLSLSLAQKGTGLAKVIYEQLNRQYQNKSTDANESPAGPMAVPARSASSLAYREPAPQAMPQPAESVPLAPAAPVPTAFANAGEFVEAILPYARAAAQTLGVNPLFLAAQAALETGWGKYIIRDRAGDSSHNLFNIKADRSWSGEKAEVSTLEYKSGVAVREQAQFRKYGHIAESFADYVRFLQSNPRYQNALAVADDDQQFAVGLQNAGYATDPAYADKILAIMQQLNANSSLTAEIF